MDGVVGQGTLLAGRYRMLRPIASDLAGSTAWDANDQILDRAVRVAILTEGRVPQAVDAARRAALVADPRLVRVLDVGDHEGVAYMITEPVTGSSLAHLVSRGPVPADQARAIIGEAAAALESARRRGVHHLTLRPSALHLTADDRVLITGLAVDAALLGQGLGDARSTTRADTVGLVALLYAALTGRWPGAAFVSSDANGTTIAGLPAAPLVEGRPVAPAELVAGIPNDLDTLCAVTLGPNDDGPHSPAELVLELEPWGDIRAVDLLAAAREPIWDPTTSAAVGSLATPPRPSRPGRPNRSAPAAPPADPVVPVVPVVPVAPVAPPTVQRQSVRSAFAAQPPGTAARPATPPPAAPARTSQFGAASGVGLGAAAGAAAAGATAAAAAAAKTSEVQVAAAHAAEATAEAEAAESAAAEAAAVEAAAVEAAAAEAAAVEAAAAEAAAAEAAAAEQAAAEGAAAEGAAAEQAAAEAAAVAADAEAAAAAVATEAAAPAPPPPAPSFPPTSRVSRSLPTPPSGQDLPAHAQPTTSFAAASGPATPIAGTPTAALPTGAATEALASMGNERRNPPPPRAFAPTAGPRPTDGGDVPPMLAFDEVVSTRGAIRTKQFDPTRLVLAVVLVAVLIGVYLAFRALTAPIGPGTPASDPLPTVTAPSTPSAEPSAEPSASEPAGAAPLIVSGQSLDPPPDGDNNEHPEAAPLAIDGDPSTSWFTRTFNSPSFAGLKTGIGYAVSLQAPATVTTVTLQVNGTGGQVEIRATDPSTPTQGPVLASGSLGGTTTLTLSAPTETQSIVLWFTSLPQAADGKNRLELAEVSLS